MYTFITNPNARSGLGAKVWKELEQILEEREVSYDVHFTKYQRHATRIVRDLTSDGMEHTIIILGGDGTVDEVINGITDLSKVTLGYIPIGSSNDFARFFGFRSTPSETLQNILDSKETTSMNIGRITYHKGEKTKRFAVSAGAGFDAAVCHQSVTSRIKVALNRLHLGRLTYVGIALSQLLALKPCTVHVSIDGKEEVSYERTYFVAAMNHPYEGGGFKFCPDADPCDGKLNITIIAGLSKLKVLFLLPTAFKGWHTVFKGVHTFTSDHFQIRSDRPLPIHTDGEPVPYSDTMTASLEHETVKLITY